MQQCYAINVVFCFFNCLLTVRTLESTLLITAILLVQMDSLVPYDAVYIREHDVIYMRYWLHCQITEPSVVGHTEKIVFSFFLLWEDPKPAGFYSFFIRF